MRRPPSTNQIPILHWSYRASSDLSDTRLTVTNPALALIESEDQVVVLKIMHDAVDAAVSWDALQSLRGLQAAVAPSIEPKRVNTLALGLEEGDSETPGLEDADHMLDDVDRLTHLLVARAVGLKGRKGVAWLGRDMDREVGGSDGRPAACRIAVP